MYSEIILLFFYFYFGPFPVYLHEGLYDLYCSLPLGGSWDILHYFEGAVKVKDLKTNR